MNSIRGLRHPVPWLGALYAVGASALLLRDPHVNVWTACPAQVLFGVGCPLCGGLRAWSDVLTGNFAAAFSENKLAAVLAVCAPIAILVWGMATRWITRWSNHLPPLPVSNDTMSEQSCAAPRVC